MRLVGKRVLSIRIFTTYDIPGQLGYTRTVEIFCQFRNWEDGKMAEYKDMLTILPSLRATAKILDRRGMSQIYHSEQIEHKSTS